MKTANTHRAEEKCRVWNEVVAVGDPVSLLKDSGQEIETTTRSEAYVSASGHPVVFLTGVAGYYLLDRVTALGKGASREV